MKLSFYLIVYLLVYEYQLCLLIQRWLRLFL